ncbi:hypothetical protein SDC9_154425 [bioreactor metagenome]|uniref:Uncharacterized protein n=1 Tax=bioreactor metagenome TaxID=1076179 RepID=A0A645F155_9ZZZZ
MVYHLSRAGHAGQVVGDAHRVIALKAYAVGLHDGRAAQITADVHHRFAQGGEGAHHIHSGQRLAFGGLA